MIENKLITTGKRVIESEKDYKEHEMTLKSEIEKLEEEKKGLVVQVKKLEEEMRVIVEMQVEETNKVIAESKASAVRTVLQAKIEMAQEDPTSWEVDTWQSILDTMDMEEEAREEEKKDEDKEGEVTSKDRA